MKPYLFFFFSFLTVAVQAADVTDDYSQAYRLEKVLSPNDLASLSQTEIVLIPGIVSEAFSWSDTRGVLDFSFIFKNYLEAQQLNFQQLGLTVSLLPGSSTSVDETFLQIESKLEELKLRKEKALFIAHSLGGLVLLDYLLAHRSAWEQVQGIIFLQSPFHGSPMANVYFQNPYFARTLLGPIMPLVHTSEETVRYLTVESRQKTMSQQMEKLHQLTNMIPIITAGGVSKDFRSLMKPSINLLSHGCVTVLRDRCQSKKFYLGPYDDSDGMVPFENSKLANVDFVKLVGVDHGETVVAMPFKNVNRVRMTDALLKLLLEKQK